MKQSHDDDKTTDLSQEIVPLQVLSFGQEGVEDLVEQKKELVC